MLLLLETKNKNIFDNSMLLEKSEKGNFFGFRWRGSSLTLGYNVSDCGTLEEIKNRLHGLISVCNEFITKWEKQNSTLYKSLIEQNTKEIIIYNEILDFLETI